MEVWSVVLLDVVEVSVGLAACEREGATFWHGDFSLEVFVVVKARVLGVSFVVCLLILYQLLVELLLRSLCLQARVSLVAF